MGTLATVFAGEGAAFFEGVDFAVFLSAFLSAAFAMMNGEEIEEAEEEEQLPEPAAPEAEESEEIDPRWAALKKLKDKD